MDESLRTHQRTAIYGSPEDEARYLHTRLRSGALTSERLRLAAALGDPAACKLLGGSQMPRPQKGTDDRRWCACVVLNPESIGRGKTVHWFACTRRYLPQSECLESWCRETAERARLAQIEQEYGVRVVTVAARAALDTWRCSDSDADLYDACMAAVVAAERWIEDQTEENARTASSAAQGVIPPTPSWAHNPGIMIFWPPGTIHDRDPMFLWSRLYHSIRTAAEIYPAGQDGIRKVIQAEVIPWVLA